MKTLIWGSFASVVGLVLSVAFVPTTAAQSRTVSAPTRLMVAQGMMGGGMMGGGMMGGGMMGGGMMGGGTMGQGMNGQSPQGGTASNPAARDLVGYVRSNGLACFSCHAVGTRRIGPALEDVARRYAGKANAQAELAGSIANGVAGKWAGYPAMPSGLASPAQASKLATLILALERHAGR